MKARMDASRHDVSQVRMHVIVGSRFKIANLTHENVAVALEADCPINGGRTGHSKAACWARYPSLPSQLPLWCRQEAHVRRVEVI